MINGVENNQLNPVCPHCKIELKQLYFQQIYSLLGKRYIYFCPSCRSSLGISHRKGFWMG